MPRAAANDLDMRNRPLNPGVAPRVLAVGIAAGYCAGLGAGDSRSTMMVRATVAPVAALELLSEPPGIAISTLDLARGYVDVSTPTGVRVRSNSTQGYALEVLPVTALFSAIAIRGLGPDVTLSADGGTIVQRWQHAQSVSLALTYRLYLVDGLQPGTYPWPLRLRVHALDAGP